LGDLARLVHPFNVEVVLLSSSATKEIQDQVWSSCCALKVGLKRIRLELADVEETVGSPVNGSISTNEEQMDKVFSATP
jgi:hypothetical protein